jgi:hypothetical protein
MWNVWIKRVKNSRIEDARQQAAEKLMIRLEAGVARRFKIGFQRALSPACVGSAGNARL